MTGLKYDNDKPRLELIDPLFTEELARILTFGAKKYESENWRKGIKYTRIIASIKRHILEFEKGNNLDNETGLSHVVHAACNTMFLYWYTLNRKEFDDRYYSPNALDKLTKGQGQEEQEQDGPIVIEEGSNPVKVVSDYFDSIATTKIKAGQSPIVDKGFGKIQEY